MGEVLVDPDAPEFPTYAALALLIRGSVWLSCGVLQDVIAKDPLMQADTALFTFLQSLHIAPIDSLMTGVWLLNSRAVMYAILAFVFVWLIFKRCWKSSAWWIVVVGVAVLLSPILEFSLRVSRPLDWIPGSPHTPLPDGRAAKSCRHGARKSVATRKSRCPFSGWHATMSS